MCFKHQNQFSVTDTSSLSGQWQDRRDKVERDDNVDFYLSPACSKNRDGEEISQLICPLEMVYCKETPLPVGPT